MDCNNNSVNWLWFNWYGLAPINIYFFIVGIFLWFSVGVIWKDKAIMVVHIGPFISIISGLIFSSN
jgi:hypothetical protein